MALLGHPSQVRLLWWPETLICSLDWCTAAVKNGITVATLRPKRIAGGMVSRSAPSLRAGGLASEHIALRTHSRHDCSRPEPPTLRVSTSARMPRILERTYNSGQHRDMVARVGWIRNLVNA